MKKVKGKIPKFENIIFRKLDLNLHIFLNNPSVSMCVFGIHISESIITSKQN